MITAAPGALFEARVEGFRAGLNTVGVQILNASGTVIAARQTSGIAESPAASGSYAVSLTAPDEFGDYQIFWDTGVISPSTTASEDLTVTGDAVLATTEISVPPPDSQTPTLADVGELTRSRTKDTNGNELGTFTTDTRPTATQVNGLIEKAASALAIRIGTNLPDALLETARDVAALDVAMRVELSFFAEQVATKRSPYNELKALHDQALADLVKALQVFDDQSGVENQLAPSGMPVFWFPTRGRTSHAPGSESDHGCPRGEW